MKRILPILIVLIVAGVAVWNYVPRWKARSQPLSGQLQLSGNIEAHESQIAFKVPGRIVELNVEEGQNVAQGALLARLEDADYRQHVGIDEANVGVRQANLTLLQAGTRQQEIEAAQQALLSAQADLEQRRLDDERARKLYAKDEISAQDRDLAATALKRAQAAFESARQRHLLALEGARKEELSMARANVRAADQSLVLSRVNLGYTRLFAPIAGVASVRQAEVGEVVQPGTPVVTLADLDHVWLRAYLPETDLGRVRLGQEVAVTTDSFNGKVFKGRISFISPSAEFTPKSVQTTQERVTLVYRMKIDLDNATHELKPGMPADARIELAAR